jgi:hypothetical protein
MPATFLIVLTEAGGWLIVTTHPTGVVEQHCFQEGCFGKFCNEKTADELIMSPMGGM